MRILLVSQYYYPALDYGGPVAKVTSMSKYLAQRGHQVAVLTSSVPNLNDELSSTAPGRLVEIGGVSVYYLRAVARFRGLSFNPGVFRFCQQHLRDCDVAHLFGLYDLLGAVAYGFARFWAVPYIVEPLGMYIPAAHGLRRKRMYHTLVGEGLLRHAEYVIATSEAEKAQLQSGRSISPGRLILRRNGIEIEQHAAPASRRRFRAEAGLKPTDRVILFLGRLTPIKNLELLIEAFAGLDVPDAHLVLAGPESERGYAAKLKTLCHQLGVSGRAHFVGAVYGENKQAALTEACFVALASHTESFGNVIAEAIAVGTPVVVTEECGIAPYVRNRVGLVSEGAVEEFRCAMFRMLTDETLYRTFKANCPAVSREFSWDEPMAMMEQLYSQAVKNKHAGPAAGVGRATE